MSEKEFDNVQELGEVNIAAGEDVTESEDIVELVLEEIDDAEMESISGGAGSNSRLTTKMTKNPGDIYHYYKNFKKYKVKNVVHYDESSELTIREKPGSKIIYYGYGWQNKETIYVNIVPSTREGYWYFVYSNKKDGKFGYSDGRYIDFNS